MKKTILYASLAALIAGTAITGTASARGGFGHGGGDAQIERMIRALDLDDTQRTEVRRIVDQARPQARALGDSLRDGRAQLGEMVKSENLDAAALQSLADAQGDAMAAAMVARAQVMHDIRGILTAEQLEKLDTLRERHGERGRGGRNRR